MHTHCITVDNKHSITNKASANRQPSRHSQPRTTLTPLISYLLSPRSSSSHSFLQPRQSSLAELAQRILPLRVFNSLLCRISLGAPFGERAGPARLNCECRACRGARVLFKCNLYPRRAARARARDTTLAHSAPRRASFLCLFIRARAPNSRAFSFVSNPLDFACTRAPPRSLCARFVCWVYMDIRGRGRDTRVFVLFCCSVRARACVCLCMLVTLCGIWVGGRLTVSISGLLVLALDS